MSWRSAHVWKSAKNTRAYAHFHRCDAGAALNLAEHPHTHGANTKTHVHNNVVCVYLHFGATVFLPSFAFVVAAAVALLVNVGCAGVVCVSLTSQGFLENIPQQQQQQQQTASTAATKTLEDMS